MAPPSVSALASIRGGMSAGVSPSAALRAFRSAGGSIRNQDWYRLWNQTAALRNRAGDAMFQPKDRLPTHAEIIERDTIRAQGMGTWVSVFQRTRGEQDFISLPFLIKSRTPITPAEAEARALAWTESAPDFYNRVTLGVAYTGTERFNPSQA